MAARRAMYLSWIDRRGHKGTKILAGCRMIIINMASRVNKISLAGRGKRRRSYRKYGDR